MAAAVGLCGCVLVARFTTPAVAPSLCVGGGVGERRRWWSCAPVGEERQRPLLTVTVFAAGDLRRWRDWCNHQPGWMKIAPHLSSLSSSSQSTADTRTARHLGDQHSDGCEPIGLCN
ncbi:hypothetical protein TcG_08855 [Trypanosoma cruzi]|nr:hypothetical protein TcG_08855 [Trypanosoma cruzi]